MVTAYLFLLFSAAFSKTVPVYSSVWSGKTFFSGSKAEYFFALPFSFNTEITYENSEITTSVANKLNDRGNLKAVNKGIADLQNSRFYELFSIKKDADGLERISVNLSHPNYNLSLLRSYRNKDFVSVQIKFDLITKKYKDAPYPAAYITYDFYLNAIGLDDVNDFMKFVDQFKNINIPAQNSFLSQIPD